MSARARTIGWLLVACVAPWPRAVGGPPPQIPAYLPFFVRYAPRAERLWHEAGYRPARTILFGDCPVKTHARNTKTRDRLEISGCPPSFIKAYPALMRFLLPPLKAGWQVGNVDAIVFAQRPKLASYKQAIRRRLAEILDVEPERVALKAKTGEGLGEIGREEVIAAQCVVLLKRRLEIEN